MQVKGRGFGGEAGKKPNGRVRGVCLRSAGIGTDESMKVLE